MASSRHLAVHSWEEFAGDTWKGNCAIVAGGGPIDLVHVGVPEYDQKGVREGWPNCYRKPWKKFLSAVEKKQS